MKSCFAIALLLTFFTTGSIAQFRCYVTDKPGDILTATACGNTKNVVRFVDDVESNKTNSTVYINYCTKTENKTTGSIKRRCSVNATALDEKIFEDFQAFRNESNTSATFTCSNFSDVDYCLCTTQLCNGAWIPRLDISLSSSLMLFLLASALGITWIP